MCVCFNKKVKLLPLFKYFGIQRQWSFFTMRRHFLSAGEKSKKAKEFFTSKNNSVCIILEIADY